jgi:hypothetical protein
VTGDVRIRQRAGRMLNETLTIPLELKRRPNGIFQSLR